MQFACSGNSFFAIIDHAGQQEVAMNGSFSGTSSDEVLGLLCGAQVRADRDLNNIRKAEALHRGTQLARCHLRAELADKRRCDSGVDTLARLNCTDHLENLRFIGNRAERAVYQTLTAGNALVVINIRSAVAVRCGWHPCRRLPHTGAPDG